MTTSTLEGFLGKDRRILGTRERTYTAMRYNDLAGREVETEITVPSRDFARLSLATHRWKSGRQETRWHQLVVWNVDEPRWQNLRLARKGDRVRVTGRLERRRFTGADGEPREVEQFVVESFSLVRIKPRREFP
jgi:single-stranded DNA-binding protein